MTAGNHFGSALLVLKNLKNKPASIYLYPRRMDEIVELIIDTAIESGWMETALRMKGVELAFNETKDTDVVFLRMLDLQKGIGQ